MFNTLTKHCASFLNYQIFQSIIDAYKLDNGQEDFKYAEHFNTFVDKHKISEFILSCRDSGTKDSDKLKLIVKLDVDSMERLSLVSNLKKELARILKMPEYLLLIVDIKVGCVEVKFLIPTALAELIFAGSSVLNRKEIEKLKALFVVSIHCSGYPQPLFSILKTMSSASRKATSANEQL